MNIGAKGLELNAESMQELELGAIGMQALEMGAASMQELELGAVGAQRSRNAGVRVGKTLKRWLRRLRTFVFNI